MHRKKLIEELFNNMLTTRRMLFMRASKTSSTLSRAQKGLLMSLQQPSSVKDLAQCFGTSPSAITQLVDSLVASGMLFRVEDSVDRRKVAVTLTTKGTKMVSRLKEKHLESFEKVFSVLTTEELVQFKKIQSKIIGALS